MKKIDEIISYFDKLFPNPICALEFSSSFELLIAVILSAQCTDKRVNIVTKELFKIANTPQTMIDLGEEKLKTIIYPCGFYNAKAKHIISACNDIINRFDGVVPNNMEDLVSLSGVGRKTANVVIGISFGGQTIAVDTHVHRISKRLGLTHENSSAFECEKDLLKIVPKDKRTRFHHQAIWFGRTICSSQKPKCEQCELNSICKYYKRKN